MKIENPEDLMQHLEKTSDLIADVVHWKINDRMVLAVEVVSREGMYALIIINPETDDVMSYVEINRLASLHWLREAS